MNSGLDKSFSQRTRELFPGGPKVSVVGFGAARLVLGEAGRQGREALAKALSYGVSLIDCSAGARDAQSELAVARVLKEAHIAPEDVSICIKVGQLRGQFLEWTTAKLWKSHGMGPSSRVMMLSEDHGLGFEASLIEEQVVASLERFGGIFKPFVLLEMPEDCLRYGAMRGLNREDAYRLFSDCVRDAFGSLRALYERGLIRGYGVSSETLGYPIEHPLSFSLSELVQWNGGEVGGFRLVSVPMNWIEWRSEDIDSAAQSSFWKGLQQFGVGLIGQRPFNALSRGQLIRLARPHLSPAEIGALNLAQSQALERWASLAGDLEQMAREVLAEYLPEEPHAPLSQLVLSTLTALPELSSVLVGMKRPEYVDDVKNALSLPRPLRARAALDAIHARFEFD